MQGCAVAACATPVGSRGTVGRIVPRRNARAAGTPDEHLQHLVLGHGDGGGDAGTGAAAPARPSPLPARPTHRGDRDFRDAAWYRRQGLGMARVREEELERAGRGDGDGDGGGWGQAGPVGKPGADAVGAGGRADEGDVGRRVGEAAVGSRHEGALAEGRLHREGLTERVVDQQAGSDDVQDAVGRDGVLVGGGLEPAQRVGDRHRTGAVVGPRVVADLGGVGDHGARAATTAATAARGGTQEPLVATATAAAHRAATATSPGQAIVARAAARPSHAGRTGRTGRGREATGAGRAGGPARATRSAAAAGDGAGPAPRAARAARLAPGPTRSAGAAPGLVAAPATAARDHERVAEIIGRGPDVRRPATTAAAIPTAASPAVTSAGRPPVEAGPAGAGVAGVVAGTADVHLQDLAGHHAHRGCHAGARPSRPSRSAAGATAGAARCPHRRHGDLDDTLGHGERLGRTGSRERDGGGPGLPDRRRGGNYSQGRADTHHEGPQTPANTRPAPACVPAHRRTLATARRDEHKFERGPPGPPPGADGGGGASWNA